MSILKCNCAIHWTVIYPVNSTVHPLKNRGLMYFPCPRTLAQPLALEMRATLCHLSKVPASLRWVFVLVVSSFLLKAWIFVSAIFIFTVICLHRCGAPTPSLLLTMFWLDHLRVPWEWVFSLNCVRWWNKQCWRSKLIEDDTGCVYVFIIL